MIEKYIANAYGLADNLTALKHILSLSDEGLWDYIKANYANERIKFENISKHSNKLYLIITNSGEFIVSIYHSSGWEELLLEFQINISNTDLTSKGSKYKVLGQLKDLPLKVIRYHSGKNISSSISILPDIFIEDCNQWFPVYYDTAMRFLQDDTAAKMCTFAYIVKNYKAYLSNSIKELYKAFKAPNLSYVRLTVVDWKRIVTCSWIPLAKDNSDDTFIVLDKKGISSYYFPSPWLLMKKHRTYVPPAIEQWVNKYKNGETQVAIKIRDELFVGITINKYQLYIMLEGFKIDISEVTYRGRCSQNYDYVVQQMSENVMGEKVSTNSRYHNLLTYAWKLIMGRV